MKQRKRKQWLNDWKLYGEKQPRDLSKRLPRNEMKDLRSRKTKYSRTNTVKDKVHGKTKYSHTNQLSLEKQLAVCL